MKNLIKSITYIVVYFFIQFIVQVIFTLLGGMLGIQRGAELMNFGQNNLILMMFLSNVIMIGICLFYFKISHKSAKTEWWIKSVKFNKWIYPAIYTFLASFAWALFMYNISFKNSAQIGRSANYYSSVAPGLGTVMMYLIVLLFQPMMEEILFRGIMLNKLSKSFPVGVAIAVSALCFGMLHFTGGGFYLAIGATLMGICYGIGFVKTGSIYTAIIAHAFSNLSGCIIDLLPELQSGVRIAVGCVMMVESIVLIVVFCTKKLKNPSVYVPNPNSSN